MTTQEAIRRLDEMQRQIIHGSRIFGDIGDIIRNSESVRRQATKELCEALDRFPDDNSLLKLHRILVTNDQDGISPTQVPSQADFVSPSSPVSEGGGTSAKQ